MNVIYYKHMKFVLNARGQIKNIYMKLFFINHSHNFYFLSNYNTAFEKLCSYRR